MAAIDKKKVSSIKQCVADFRETFDDVFDKVFECYKADYDAKSFKQTVVYFLSDGDEEVTFDEAKIGQFTNLPDVKDSLRFFGVAFGEEELPSLKTMCEKMPNGDFSRAKTKMELKKSLLRLIQ